jgi:hypothetical protein
VCHVYVCEGIENTIYAQQVAWRRRAEGKYLFFDVLISFLLHKTPAQTEARWNLHIFHIHPGVIRGEAHFAFSTLTFAHMHTFQQTTQTEHCDKWK